MTARSRDEVVRELADWAYEREANYSLATVTAIVERAFDAGRVAEREAIVQWLRDGGDYDARLSSDIKSGCHLP